MGDSDGAEGKRGQESGEGERRRAEGRDSEVVRGGGHLGCVSPPYFCRSHFASAHSMRVAQLVVLRLRPLSSTLFKVFTLIFNFALLNFIVSISRLGETTAVAYRLRQDLA